MILPIGSDESQGQLPIATIAIIAICTLLYVAFPFETSIENKLESFCESSVGEDVTYTLKEAGLEAKSFKLEPDYCEPAAIAIVSNKAQGLIEKSNFTVDEKQDALKLVAKAKTKLNVWEWRAFQPRSFSFKEMVTSTFFHDGFMHLIINMLVLWIFGRVLEDHIGSLKFIGVFLGSAMFADVVYALITFMGLSEGLPSLGASAGVYGVMAGVWRRHPYLKINCMVWMITVVRIIKVPASILFVFYVGRDILSLLTNASTGVNFVAHLAGFFIVYISMEQWKKPQGKYSQYSMDVVPVKNQNDY